MSGLPKIEPGAIVCKGAIVTGDVTIGTGTIVHTTASIIAQVRAIWLCVCVLFCCPYPKWTMFPWWVQDGPIVIGKHNLIEERVTIINE